MKQDYVNLEIIVVDDGSKDKTSQIVTYYSERHPAKIKLVKLDKNLGSGTARNIGAQAANGKILLFLDADMVFPSDYVSKLIEPILTGEELSTVHGAEIVNNIENPWVKVQGQMKKPSPPARAEIFRAIARDVFLKYNGYDGSFHYHSDRTFFYKTGLKAKKVEDAVCYHNNPDTAMEVFRRNYLTGRTLIAVELYENGLKGLARVIGLVFVRTVDLLAVPLLIALIVSLLWGRIMGENIFLTSILAMPSIPFGFLTAKMRILKGKSLAESIALRSVYAPAYRILRAAGLLTGIAVSLFRGLKWNGSTTSRPPNRAPRAS